MKQQNTVLIVDDEPKGRKTLQALLLAEGHELAFANNGQEALEKMDTYNPDVILLDVMMPGLNGFEVCHRLKSSEEWQHVPIILVTALDSKNDVADGLEAGADDFLSKPIDKLELRARVRSMLRIKGQYDKLTEQREQLALSLHLNQKFAQAVALHVEELEILHELGIQLMNNLSTDSVLDLISQTALEIIPEAAGCIMYLTPDGGQQLLPIVMSNENSAKLVQPNLGIEEIVRQVIERKKTTNISNLLEYSQYLQNQSQEMQSLLIAPVADSQSLLGAISVYDPKADVFSETQAHLLSILTHQAEAAISRARSVEVRERTNKQEKYAIQDMFQRYVSPKIVDGLINGNEPPVLGGKRQEISILFADIRGFTSFSETMPPERLIKILNQYLPLAVEAILEQEGTLDKIMGDAVMGIFNAPVPQPDHLLRAIRAALTLQKAIYQLQTTNDTNLSFGIGIHVGQAVVGNIGTDQHMNYTAIGDTVNLAWRLQENAKGGQVILSQAAYSAVKDMAVVEELGPIMVKGRTAVEPVYALTGLIETRKMLPI